MTESHPVQPDDKYSLLGLTVISRHEAKGLEEASKNFQTVSKKIRVVQLITAVALLIFLVTDMLPFVPVLLSSAAVFFTAVFVGKKLLASAVSETKSILEKVEFGEHHEVVLSAVSDSNFAQEILQSGVFIFDETEVLNVDGDSLVLCRKTEPLPA